MEAKAILRYVGVSPRKARVVANVIRGKKLTDVLGRLQMMPKKSARILSKLVQSAMANAEDRSQGKTNVDELVVKTVQVDNGPMVKRWMARAQGKANRIQKRTSHITVVLDDQIG